MSPKTANAGAYDYDIQCFSCVLHRCSICLIFAAVTTRAYAPARLTISPNRSAPPPTVFIPAGERFAHVGPRAAR